MRAAQPVEEEPDAARGFGLYRVTVFGSKIVASATIDERVLGRFGDGVPPQYGPHVQRLLSQRTTRPNFGSIGCEPQAVNRLRASGVAPRNNTDL